MCNMGTSQQMATGNEIVTILDHHFLGSEYQEEKIPQIGVCVAIRNISELTIATAIFDAIFYDIEGNIIYSIKHKEFELKPKMSRAFHINCPISNWGIIKGYNIKTIKTAMSDVEKVQLRRHEIRTKDGTEEIRGILKNISNNKTDSALVATFKNPMDEIIGIKVICVKDIEPDTVKTFHFVFDPPEGEAVKTYSLEIGDMVEEVI